MPNGPAGRPPLPSGGSSTCTPAQWPTPSKDTDLAISPASTASSPQPTSTAFTKPARPQAPSPPLSFNPSQPSTPLTPAPTNTTYSANFTPSPSPTPLSAHMSARGSLRMQSGLDGGARGFLSTQAIGAQGRRGVWIERKRASTLREVQVWGQASPAALESYVRAPPPPGVTATAIEIPRRIVHSLQSFDLRGDPSAVVSVHASGAY